MTDDRAYGDWVDLHKRGRPISELRLKIVPLDLVAHWRRCGLTADYLATFLAYNFGDREAALTVVSTVLNEVLENCVKFSNNKDASIDLLLAHFGDTLAVEAVNTTDKGHADLLVDWVRRVSEGDPEELFIKQLEYTAATDAAASGVGLITLRKDYGARIGVNVAGGSNDSEQRVAVQIVIDAEEVEKQ